MLGVLRVRDFRLLATGQLLSSLGDWLLLVAAPFYVLRLTGSTLATGLSLAAETVPALLLGPVAGVFADRWDRRRTMLVTDLARAAAVALLLLVHHREQVWLVYAALFTESAFGQFFNPARRALIPAVVGRGPDLDQANSLAALVAGAVQLVGGPVGGALYALTGFTPAVAVDIGSYLASAALVAAIGVRAAPVAAGREGSGREGSGPTLLRGFLDDVRGGAAHIRATRGFPVVLVVAAVCFGGNAVLTALLVPYVDTVLHADAQLMGWLFAALGAGFLAGAPLSRLVAARLPARTVAVTALGFLSVVFAAAFDVRDTAADLVLFALIGPPAVCFTVTVDTFIARSTPDHLMGRAGAAYGMSQAAATLLGAVGGAVLGQRLGILPTTNLAALLVAASACTALLIPRQLGDGHGSVRLEARLDRADLPS